MTKKLTQVFEQKQATQQQCSRLGDSLTYLPLIIMPLTCKQQTKQHACLNEALNLNFPQ